MTKPLFFSPLDSWVLFPYWKPSSPHRTDETSKTRTISPHLSSVNFDSIWCFVMSSPFPKVCSTIVHQSVCVPCQSVRSGSNCHINIFGVGALSNSFYLLTNKGFWGLGFGVWGLGFGRSEEHTSELQSQSNLVCRLLLEK